MEKKIKYLEEQLKTDDAIKFIDEYTTMLEKYKLNGGYEYKKEYEFALLKLEEFSGGQRTKLAFLKLLLSKPDILLLDEPTNHLDITTVEWLEDYLKNYPKAVVIVSHDRMFLDNIVNKVYEIEYGMLTKYKGNYSSFEKQKKAREMKKNSKVVTLKETQLSVTIDTHDKNVKLKRTLKWLEEGNKVKVAIRFRGRQLAHVDLGKKVIDDFVEECAEVGQIEKPAKLEGRTLTAILAPKKKK